MIFKDELDRAGPVVDRLNAAIRDNPLAAGLIGAGVAWMLMGGAKAMAGAAKGAAGMAGSAAATAGGTLARGVTNASSATATGLRTAAGSVASLVPDISAPDTNKAFETVADTAAAVGDRVHSAAVTGREYSAVIQSRLSESLEKQPLLLGAIGLAIGAGIASTFATTKVENELMGKQGAAAREKLQSLGEAVKDRAERVASEVKNEAEKQRLTPDEAMKAASEIGKKVKAVASAGRESVTQNLRPN